MIFVIDGIVYDPEIIYTNDTPRFRFADNNHDYFMGYWSIEHGGHLKCITEYQNGNFNGTQYGWWPMSRGGHQSYIENYKNDQKHGLLYEWYVIQEGGHLHCVENYQNNCRHGIQRYWRPDKSYYTESY
jgi:antitoxin component YwqK of YwqJK toxin-antitoxin module